MASSQCHPRLTFLGSLCSADVGEGSPVWDFGLHPSDAAAVCGGMMGREEGATPTHTWHPGRLLYYSRAELKQSDHR